MTASNSPEPLPARASDAERQAVVAELHDAFTRGLLTMEEAPRADGRRVRRPVRAGSSAADGRPPTRAGARSHRAGLAGPGRPRLAPAARGRRGLLLRGSARTVRARPRIAVAAVALLALLSIAAVSTGPLFGDHGPASDGRRIERIDHFGPH